MIAKSAIYPSRDRLESLSHLLHTLGFEMPDDHYLLMDGKLHVYRRERSRFWQCSTFLNGRNHRQSTKEDNLSVAKDFAQAWYMETFAAERRRRRGAGPEQDPLENSIGTDPSAARARRTPKGPKGPLFREVAQDFVAEFTLMTQGERNAKYVEGKSLILRTHLLPFFGDRPLRSFDNNAGNEYRVHRMTSRTNKAGEVLRPARATLHSEIVTLRQVLDLAKRKGLIDQVPDLSAPYKASNKVTHRAWFSPAEYELLWKATRDRAANPPKERWRAECEKLHDYVLFMANTGLRPDEASRLEFRDVSIVKDPNHADEKILEIEVRKGKRGAGYCKSMPGAVFPFQRVQRRRKGYSPTDLVFGKVQRELLNNVLEELNLKTDRDGQVRSAYSLRHTYISLRLMEGADIYQIAKNCRTSVEMIEKFYASHIKNMIDTAATNVRRTSKVKETVRENVRRKRARTGKPQTS